MSKKKFIALILVVVGLIWAYFSGALTGILRTIWMISGDAYPYVSGALIVLLVLAFTRQKWILLAAVIVAVWWGGYYVMEENKVMDRAEEVSKWFLEENYIDINTIEITVRERIPSGRISVEGHVNGNKEFDFGVMISPSDFSVTSMSTSPDFPKSKSDTWKVSPDD